MDYLSTRDWVELVSLGRTAAGAAPATTSALSSVASQPGGPAAAAPVPGAAPTYGAAPSPGPAFAPPGDTSQHLSRQNPGDPLYQGPNAMPASASSRLAGDPTVGPQQPSIMGPRGEDYSGLGSRVMSAYLGPRSEELSGGQRRGALVRSILGTIGDAANGYAGRPVRGGGLLGRPRAETSGYLAQNDQAAYRASLEPLRSDQSLTRSQRSQVEHAYRTGQRLPQTFGRPVAGARTTAYDPDKKEIYKQEEMPDGTMVEIPNTRRPAPGQRGRNLTMRQESSNQEILAARQRVLETPPDRLDRLLTRGVNDYKMQDQIFERDLKLASKRLVGQPDPGYREFHERIRPAPRVGSRSPAAPTQEGPGIIDTAVGLGKDLVEALTGEETPREKGDKAAEALGPPPGAFYEDENTGSVWRWEP